MTSSRDSSLVTGDGWWDGSRDIDSVKEKSDREGKGGVKEVCDELGWLVLTGEDVADDKLVAGDSWVKSDILWAGEEKEDDAIWESWGRTNWDGSEMILTLEDEVVDGGDGIAEADDLLDNKEIPWKGDEEDDETIFDGNEMTFTFEDDLVDSWCWGKWVHGFWDEREILWEDNEDEASRGRGNWVGSEMTLNLDDEVIGNRGGWLRMMGEGGWEETHLTVFRGFSVSLLLDDGL